MFTERSRGWCQRRGWEDDRQVVHRCAYEGSERETQAKFLKNEEHGARNLSLSSLSKLPERKVQPSLLSLVLFFIPSCSVSYHIPFLCPYCFLLLLTFRELLEASWEGSRK